MSGLNTKTSYKDIFVQTTYLFCEFKETLDSVSKITLYNAGIDTGNVHF